MAVYRLLSKCDQAVAAYLISESAGTDSDVFPAKRAATLPNLPFTVVLSDDASEVVKYSGNYALSCTVEIHTNSAPDKDQDTEQMRLDSDARVAATFDALHSKYNQSGHDLADLITSAAAAAGIADFTVENVTDIEIGQGRTERDGEWIDTLTLKLICRPSSGD
jgi:hypothetical protein